MKRIKNTICDGKFHWYINPKTCAISPPIKCDCKVLKEIKSFSHLRSHKD